jgi:hypothetical protein
MRSPSVATLSRIRTCLGEFDRASLAGYDRSTFYTFDAHGHTDYPALIPAAAQDSHN